MVGLTRLLQLFRKGGSLTVIYLLIARAVNEQKGSLQIGGEGDGTASGVGLGSGYRCTAHTAGQHLSHILSAFKIGRQIVHTRDTGSRADHVILVCL